MKISISSQEIIKYLYNQQVGDADLMAKIYQGQFIWDHANKMWYRWAAHYWEVDSRADVYHCAEELAETYRGCLREISNKINESDDDKVANNLKKIEKELRSRIAQLKKRNYINDILSLVRMTSQRLSTDGESWNNQPEKICFENGCLNLDTLVFSAGNPDDLITRHCDCEWAGIDAEAPRWSRFLVEIFDRDLATIDFVQRLFGYAISGKLASERAIFPILWGNGRNGKNLLVEAIAGVLGNYSAPMRSETFIEDARHAVGRNQATPDLIQMAGRLLVYFSETGANRKLAGPLIKSLTGDQLAAVRDLFQGQTFIQNRAKIFMLTNYLPIVDADDYALWRRLLIIPFGLSFVPQPTTQNERMAVDGLPEIFSSERSGIAAWLVSGYRMFCDIGLDQSEAVRQATAQYRLSVDSISGFLAAECKTGDGFSERAQSLFDRYVEYCAEEGIFQMSHIKFFASMKKRFRYERRADARWYFGVMLSCS